MDTAKDARVLVFEDAIRRLNDIVVNRKLKIHVEYGRLTDLLKSAAGLIYEIKYSYVDSIQLAEMDATKKAVSSISELGDAVHFAIAHSGFKPKTVNEQETHAELDYCLRIVGGFPRRLKGSAEDPGYAVDVLGVEISQTKAVEGSSKLTHCRCTDGSRIWSIVTNIPGLKPGRRLACAVLPPVEMMGILSEAMFLSEDTLPETVPLGLLSSVPSAALAQARAHVLEMTRRLT